jgi:hypothetical protein
MVGTEESAAIVAAIGAVVVLAECSLGQSELLLLL